jgi:ribonuclease E
MKKMLINARQSGETRIAIVNDNVLVDLYIENIDREQKKSNIYRARVSRIEPSLNAIFVNYGEDKNGFLPYKEISPEYFKNTQKDQGVPLNELLDVGQELIVQIVKDERGSKGAALTTYVTLAGCYMVLMPNNPNTGGISRRIEGEERRKLKELLDSLTIPKDMSIIIRTAGVDRSVGEIQADLDNLINLWGLIKHASLQKKVPFLIYKESDIIIRAIRDHLKKDIEQIIIDEQEAYSNLKYHLATLRPQFNDCLSLYDRELPLFNSHQIEHQIESAFKREISLDSGGSIVIDMTEALTAIDINSARSTKGDSIEQTALATNLEAAVEIAKQLRLRDLGGLIVVDFIDMSLFPNQKAVEQQFIDVLLQDRAKIQMTRISRFGLIEISRQRLQSSLRDSVMQSCPRCNGHGLIRSIPSLASSIIRGIHSAALKEKTNEIRVQLPVEIATFLLNEKRYDIYSIEHTCKVKVILIPNINIQSPHFNIQRIWGDVYNANKASFDLIEKDKEVPYKRPKVSDKSGQPALKFIQHYDKNINRKSQKGKNTEVASPGQDGQKIDLSTEKKGFWAGIQSFFFNDLKSKKVPQQEVQKPHKDELKISPSSQPHRPRSSQQQNKYKTQELQDKKNSNLSSSRMRDSNRNKRRDSNHVNNHTDLSHNSKNIRSRQQSSISRLQVHQSEEIVDISTLKENSPAVVKMTREEKYMKNISVMPETKISGMVKEVLARTSPITYENNVVQVETSTPGKRTKYLKFEVVTLDFKTDKTRKIIRPKVLENTQTQLKKGNINNKVNSVIDKRSIQVTKEDSNKTVRLKPQPQDPYISYSSAIDINSQGYIFGQVKLKAGKKKN